MALLRGAVGWYVVCDCGISWSYSFTFWYNTLVCSLPGPGHTHLHFGTIRWFVHFLVLVILIYILVPYVGLFTSWSYSLVVVFYRSTKLKVDLHCVVS